jgi:DNA-binding MarR family transcriptional regulator
MNERDLQQQIQEFIRRFGLLSQESTPCQYPISPSQSHTLQLLGQAAILTQQQLAVQLNLDKSTISRLVAQLVERGWVHRTTNPGNRREVHLSLSETGCVILNEVSNASITKFQTIWERLPQDKRAQVLEALIVLNTVVREE